MRNHFETAFGLGRPKGATLHGHSADGAMTKRSLVPEEVLPLKKPAPLRRGVRLWEINTSLHCSIIGTCLSTTELRKILMRMNVTGAQTADEHELHVLGVIAAGRWDDSMFLQKALISDIVER